MGEPRLHRIQERVQRESSLSDSVQCASYSLCDVTHPYIVERQTLKINEGPHYCRKLLAAMSNRRIKDVSNVAAALTFIAGPSSNSELHTLLRQSFQYRLIRWLYGKGHPAQLKGIYIPDDVFDQERDDAFARARLLLRGMTEIEIVPITNFQLKV